MPLKNLTYLGETEQLIFTKGNLAIRVTLFNPSEQSLVPGQSATLYLPESSSLILPMDPPSSSGA
jgi:hypothetical protein